MIELENFNLIDRSINISNNIISMFMNNEEDASLNPNINRLDISI